MGVVGGVVTVVALEAAVRGLVAVLRQPRPRVVRGRLRASVVVVRVVDHVRRLVAASGQRGTRLVVGVVGAGQLAGVEGVRAGDRGVRLRAVAGEGLHRVGDEGAGGRVGDIWEEGVCA